MRKYLTLDTVIILLVIVAFISTSAKAAVTDISCDFKNYEDPGLYNWNFDYDLQQLTITETVLTLDINVPFPDRKYIEVIGLVDSISEFNVSRTFHNNTGITWTGCVLENFAPLPGGGVFITGTASSTKLQTITYSNPDMQYSSEIEFTGTPVVPDGESITIQFYFLAPPVTLQGAFINKWRHQIIPEPTTISLLALGSLLLFRKHENHNLQI